MWLIQKDFTLLEDKTKTKTDPLTAQKQHVFLYYIISVISWELFLFVFDK